MRCFWFFHLWTGWDTTRSNVIFKAHTHKFFDIKEEVSVLFAKRRCVRCGKKEEEEIVGR